jgi:hypothetical protein
MMAQSQRHIGIDDTDIKPEIARIAPGIGKKISDTMAEAFAFDSAAQCLSSDDPRLVATPTPAPMKPEANAGKFGLKITIPIPGSDRDRAPNLTWGMGVIRYTPGRPIVAVVRLNGRSSARLILDTGADGSIVKAELLAAAGVDLTRPAARGKISGVTGKVEVSYFPVDLEVAGHRARVLRVAAFNDENDIADGLLGRDFLDRFKVVMDPASGTVTLTPK